MNIHIGDNIEFLELVDIVTEGEERGYNPVDSDFLRVTLLLKMDGIQTNIRATFMLGEFKQLLSDLKKLYDTLKYEFVFSNLEDNVEVKFSPTDNGHIELNGYLRNSEYTGSVNFKLTTDQTFLPTTISQIRDVLKNLNNKI